MKRFLALALISFAAACSSGGGDDGPSLVDGGGDDDPDAAGQAECFAEASYASISMPGAQSSGGTASAPDGVTAQSALNAAEPFDIFQLELIKGYGVFTTNITTGNFTLSGDELNYATCGLCPRVFTDCTQTECNEQQFYATGGTINVTSITPNLTFTVSNLTLVEVTVAKDFTSTPVPGGCSTTISSASFDAPNTHTP